MKTNDPTDCLHERLSYMIEDDGSDIVVPADSAIFSSDHALLEQFRNGQMDASTALYLKYADRLMGLTHKKSSSELARQVDPEDIVQSVFRTFFRRVEDGQYSVPEGEDIWKLLLVIALNKLRTLATYHKAAKRDTRRTQTDSGALENISNAKQRDELAVISLKMVIDDLMSTLLEVNQRIIKLRIEGYEVSEIAEQTQRSKRTVERVLQDFRSKLSQLVS